MANQFHLDTAINTLMAEVSSKGTLTAEDIKELKLHLYDSAQNLKLSGLNDEEAFQVAKIRLGNKDALILEYEKVNGRSIVNKEWIFIFIGIGISIIVSNLLLFTQTLIGYFNAIGKITTTNAAYLLSFAHLLILLLVIYIFKKGEKVVLFFKETFYGSQIILITIFSVVAGLLTFVPLTKFLGPRVYNQSLQALNEIFFDSRFTETIIRGTIPITIALAIFLSIHSVNQKIGWQTVFKSHHYLYIFILGIGLETTASLLSRQLFPSAWFGPIIFGVTIIAGMLAFIHFNKEQHGIWVKLSCFISFSLGIEVFASIYRGEGKWTSSPLFYYGIGIIISIALGFLIGFQSLRNENTKKLRKNPKSFV